MNAENLAVIDADTRRRAAVCFRLARLPMHIEPFENLAEIWSNWKKPGPILVCDEPDAVSGVNRFMVDSGNWMPIVAYAEAPTVEQVVQAIKAGAIDYLAWPFDLSAVARTIDRVGPEISRIANRRLREFTARRRVQTLSNRERQVLVSMSNGLSNRRIAEVLAISSRTVEVYRANMLKKLGASHTSEAIRMALDAGLDE